MSQVIRHDMFQSDEKVEVSIMIKNAEQLNCKVTIEKDRLLVEADGYYKLDLNLCESINVEKSFYKIKPVKVEVTLMKVVGRRWAALTKEVAEMKPAVVKIYSKDFDAIEKSIEQDKTEGDEAVNECFQKLFASADPDTRRAMVKSYYESNGTCLSMNWKEVGAKKTETSPPDGTEFVPYNK